MKYKEFNPYKFIQKCKSHYDLGDDVISVDEANELADEIKKLREALYDLSQKNKTLKGGLEKLKKSIEVIVKEANNE